MARKLLQAARLVAFAALAALASCGGGGGGGGGGDGVPPPVQSGGGGSAVPATPVALNSTNAQDAAAGAMLTGLGATNNLSSQVDGASALRTVIPQRLPQTHVLAQIIRQQINQLTQQLQAAPVVPVSAALAPHACANGGNVDATPTGPDSLTETFTACSPATGVTINGTIAISSMSVDPGVSFNGAATINLVIKQTGSPDASITANNVSVLETVNVNVITFTLSGPQLLIVTTDNTEQLANFTLVASFDDNAKTETDDVSFTYSSTKLGGSINVSTGTPCVTDAARNFPRTGVLSFAGTGGSKVRVTINGDETLLTPQLRIEIDADGDGTFESSSDRNWADLAA